MRHKFIHTICITLLVAGIAACTPGSKNTAEKRYTFNNILDIAYHSRYLGTAATAGSQMLGSWMGFTLPEKENWVNGFCGPFSLDMFRRQWMAQSAVTVGFSQKVSDTFVPDSTCYYPGELYMSAHSGNGTYHPAA